MWSYLQRVNMKNTVCQGVSHLVLIKRGRLKLPLLIKTPHCQ